MSSGVANYGAAQYLQIMLGVIESPSQYWVALCTDQPGEGMDGDILTDIEPDRTLTNYARVPIACGPGHWALNGQQLTNIDTVDFGVPDASWGQITHYALLDDPTSGNLWAFGEFLNPQEGAPTFQVLIPQGGIVLGLYGLENSIAV